jgi:hypothetical protein
LKRLSEIECAVVMPRKRSCLPKLRKLIFPATVLVCAGGCSRSQLRHQQEFNQSYPLQPGGKFELQNVNGTVEVQGWDRDVVVPRGENRKVERIGLGARLHRRPRQRRRSFLIATRYPQNEGVEVARWNT